MVPLMKYAYIKVVYGGVGKGRLKEKSIETELFWSKTPICSSSTCIKSANSTQTHYGTIRGINNRANTCG